MDRRLNTFPYPGHDKGVYPEVPWTYPDHSLVPPPPLSFLAYYMSTRRGLGLFRATMPTVCVAATTPVGAATQ